MACSAESKAQAQGRVVGAVTLIFFFICTGLDPTSTVYPPKISGISAYPKNV